MIDLGELDRRTRSVGLLDADWSLGVALADSSSIDDDWPLSVVPSTDDLDRRTRSAGLLDVDWSLGVDNSSIRIRDVRLLDAGWSLGFESAAVQRLSDVDRSLRVESTDDLDRRTRSAGLLNIDRSFCLDPTDALS